MRHTPPVLIVLALMAAPAVAQGPPRQQPPRWSLGLGIISAPQPYVGTSNETRVIPLVEYRSERFYVQGIRLGYHLVTGERVTLDLRARARFDGYDADDSWFLAGMEDRRESVDAGLGLEWELGELELDVTACADVLGRSDGLEAAVDLSWFKVFGKGRFGIRPGLGVIWQSGKLVDYYYGVRPEEALPERPAFEGQAGFNFEAGVLAFYRLSPNIRAAAFVRAKQLGNEIEGSPIVDRDFSVFGLLGLSYAF